MPLIKARSSSIMDNVDLRGQPTAATAAQTVNTTQLASTAYVRSAISDLVNASPALLNTLAELAAAINNDEAFSTTIANSIATKVALDGSVAMTGLLTLSGAPTANLHAATKKYVDDLVDGQMIYSTDDVPEGQSLYYTDTRVRSAVSLDSDNTVVLDYDSTSGQFTYRHPTSNGILEGNVNLYFTTARARNSISMNSDDAAIISYSAITGAFTFVTPNSDKIVEGATNKYFTTSRARSGISAGANIDYDNATGVLSTQAAVWSVNTQTHDVVLDTDDVLEGSANQYFTAARAHAAISLTTNDSNILSYSNGVFTFAKPNTDAISEGSTNQYYTDNRVRAAVSASGDISYNSATGNFSYSTPTTDGVTEGANNLYFTDTRARLAISLTSDKTSVLDYDSATGEFTFNLGNQTTTDIAEGTNLYYTNTRARASISTTGWGNLSYNNTTGVITITAPSTTNVSEGTNLYYTDTRVRNAISATQPSGDGAFSYDNTTGVFEFVGPDDADYRQAVSAYKASGDGNLAYDSLTGVFTYTGPSSTDLRVHFSATTSGTGFGNLTYNSATGVFTYAKVTSSDVRGEISATTASGVTYTSATGVIALSSIPNSSLTNSDITVNSHTIALGGSYTLDTDDIGEGATNKYWTQTRFDTALAASDTDDLAEGAGNLYYTQARFDSAFAAKDTADLAEDAGATATSGTQYFTQSRARNVLSGGTGVTYTAGTGVIEIGQAVGTTDNVTFNDLTVAGDLTVQGTLTAIQSTTVEINDVNLTLAKGSPNAAAANGAGLTIDGASATLTYASGDDSWNFNKDVNITGGLTLTQDLSAPTFTGDLTGDVDAVNVSVSSLTDMRVVFAGAGGDLVDDSRLSWHSGFGQLTTYQLIATSAAEFRSTVKVTGLTTGRVTFAGADHVLADSSSLTFDSATGILSATAFTGDLTGNVTGDLTGNVTGNVTGQVSDISNHTTDTLTEGTTNVYYTDTRSRAALTGGNSGTGHGSLSYNSGTGAFTFAKVTASNIRGELSATKVSGDGNFSYNSTTGVFSYTGPTDVDSRAHFSADNSTGAAFDQATGIISLANIPNASLANSDITINGYTIALGGSDTLDTDDIGEGTTNKYFLDSRARNAISLTTSDATTLSYDPATGVFDFDLTGINTDEIAEGSTNKYFTQTRARQSISSSGWSNLSYSDTTGVITITAPSTADVTEDSGYLYFTNTRAAAAISLTTDNTDALSYNTATGEFSFTLNSVNTDEIAEGTTNLYFTTARARNTIVNGANIDYNASTGTVSTQAAVWSVNGQDHAVVLDSDDITEGSTNLYFTAARAQGSLTVVTNDSNILSYATGTLTFNKPNTDAVAEGAVNQYYTVARGEAVIAAASIRDLSDVNKTEALQDGYTLVWNSFLGEFVPQNIAVQAITLNFTGDGSTSSFSTGAEVTSIDNTQVYINGLIQAPTYSYTINTVSNVTSIVFDVAPETNDYIFVRVSAANTLSAGGVLNEGSNIDGGTY